MAASNSATLIEESIDAEPFWNDRPDSLAFCARMSSHLELARQSLDKLLSVTGALSFENTLRPYDEIQLHIDIVSSQASLMEVVHPDADLREAAERATQDVSAFQTELSLNHKVYLAIAGLDLSTSDAETRYYVERELRDFRLAGVDKDDETRRRIKELRDELVVIGQEFDKNIREDVRTITAESVAELNGLPADYIAKHSPAVDQPVTITTDYPDSLPIFAYANNEDLRKRMYFAYNNRAFPQNMDVLTRMIERRHELANLLGFPHWADYITANKMVGNAANASAFVDRVVEASGEKAAREFKVLLERKRQDIPDADNINPWETTYYNELVRRTSFDFDSQSVRPYFQYERVKNGLLDITSKLFGVTIRQEPEVPVWHESVECFEMLMDGLLIARFYLDMHPRENKYKHAAQFNIRTGARGRQIPEAALVCNLPGGEGEDPGLLSHEEVVTFFHEFGHLVHALLAGRHQWVGIGGNNTEQDFVEAPSQLLEEWTWDPSTLALFARHFETDEPIRANLVKQMRLANEFGKALGVRRQMVFAKLSLSIYDRDPKTVDVNAILRRLNAEYLPFPFVDGTNFVASFGHLDGYSAVYYTYMWSLVIAKDFFSTFDKSNLLAPATRYRDCILAAGASKAATDMVKDFLGRPFDFRAWQEWLDEGD